MTDAPAPLPPANGETVPDSAPPAGRTSWEAAYELIRRAKDHTPNDPAHQSIFRPLVGALALARAEMIAERDPARAPLVVRLVTALQGARNWLAIQLDADIACACPTQDGEPILELMDEGMRPMIEELRDEIASLDAALALVPVKPADPEPDGYIGDGAAGRPCDTEPGDG